MWDMSVYIHVPYVHNLGVHGRFYGLNLKTEMVVIESRPWQSLDWDEDNDCIFKVQREEYWIHTRPTWSIAVRKRLLELLYD